MVAAVVDLPRVYNTHIWVLVLEALHFSMRSLNGVHTSPPWALYRLERRFTPTVRQIAGLWLYFTLCAL